MSIQNRTSAPPPEEWRKLVGDEFRQLAETYFVLKKPLEPEKYTQVVTKIRQNCEAILLKADKAPDEVFTTIINELDRMNQQAIDSLSEKFKKGELKISKGSLTQFTDQLSQINKRVQMVALDRAVAQEQWEKSLAGRATDAAITGLAHTLQLSEIIPIAAQALIDLTNIGLDAGANYLASKCLPDVAKGLAPTKMLQHASLRSFTFKVLEKVAAKPVSSVPIARDSPKIQRALTKGAKSVTSFDQNIFQPLQLRLLHLTAPGNFQQLAGVAAAAFAQCLNVAEQAEKERLTPEERKQWMIDRLMPGLKLATYDEQMRKRSIDLIGKIMEDPSAKNIASKILGNLLLKFSDFAGITSLILLTSAETFIDKKLPSDFFDKSDPNLFGKMLSERVVELAHQHPEVARALATTGGWEKIQAMENYADIASLFIQYQLAKEAAMIVLQQKPITPHSPESAKRVLDQTKSFENSFHQLIDSIHMLTTDNKSWDQYWLQLFTRLPKEQLLKRVDWNAQILEPLRKEWRAWIEA